MKRTLAAALTVLSLAVPAQLRAAQILSVGSATVSVGDTFTIPVSISGAVDLTSFQFDLSFLASILQVTPTGVTESAFFTQSDITTFNPGVVTSSQILGVSDALSFQPAVNGDGVLVDIEFHADAPGTSPLTLSNTFLNLLDTGFSVTNGSVCVLAPGSSVCAPGSSVPEPGTLMMLSAALGLLALCLRRSSAA
jgi:hypothetical protein